MKAKGRHLVSRRCLFHPVAQPKGGVDGPRLLPHPWSFNTRSPAITLVRGAVRTPADMDVAKGDAADVSRWRFLQGPRASFCASELSCVTLSGTLDFGRVTSCITQARDQWLFALCHCCSGSLLPGEASVLPHCPRHPVTPFQHPAPRL